MSARPTVLVVSGLDPTGCAGFLLDARVIAELGGRAIGAVSVLTEQSSAGLRRADPVDPELVGDQLRALLSEEEVAAVKVGALGSDDVARRVSDALALTGAPVVWDPVARASAGGPALSGDLAATAELLGPHLTLTTPNRAEAAALLGRAEGDDARATALELGAAIEGSVLLTGGHFAGDTVVDYLWDGATVEPFESPRVPDGENVRGTGCALSSAIATRLAFGAALPDAITTARGFVAERMAESIAVGRGLRALL